MRETFFFKYLLALQLAYPECWVPWGVHAGGNEMGFLSLLQVFSIPSPHLPQKPGNSGPSGISE